jgi:hypothetical protein
MRHSSKNPKFCSPSLQRGEIFGKLVFLGEGKSMNWHGNQFINGETNELGIYLAIISLN